MGMKESLAEKKAGVNAWLEGKPAFVILKRTVKEFGDDNGSRIAAALAYYGIFSLAPLLLIATVVAGLAYGEEAAQGRLSDRLEGTVGTEAASAIESMVQAADRPVGMTLAGLVGFVVLLWGASRVVVELESAMNTIWEVKPKPKSGWKESVKDRASAFGIVLLTGVILLAVLAAGALIPAVATLAGDFVPGSAVLWQLVHLAVAIGAATLLFAVLFRYLPDARVAWDDVWKGAFFTAVLFALGMLAFGVYVGRSATTNTYGAAGSVVALLLWLYVSAALFIFGAEFTQVYANSQGSKVKPGQGARPERGETPSDASTPSRPDESDRRPSERDRGPSRV